MGAWQVQGSGAPQVRSREGSAVFDAAARDFAAWQSGDAEALDRLVRLLTPVLWHVVRAYRLDQQSAEDVVQATWVTLVRSTPAIQDPQAVVRWLTVTARREALRCARGAQRLEPVEDDVLDLRVSDLEGPESAVLRDHRDQALWRAVSQLNERCQRLLRIVAFAERPNYTRVSGELQMPVGSIGPTRSRCLDKLRTLLGSAKDWRLT